ncbi:hypothetical protein SAICODRAFT_63335 [Saitoella complicata NRRL Y-17804]|uniref:uncharacterized protein n=1 Tax=Saitoella complicata (strain BCRC 22490 / CBS 7301 / JCM 7358 / NBRC 10748 / NRRL Y-17804) TaxID=698492 RepID=UPI0008672AB2|nr:uncharacterized protein SAICODRAFT_63335 [Saitoella complicata NRRL Y-17804]ODQ56279.1 hypothetical protein SAICODRAFT_63335 [Saitoella complicata NRRL Y-17804]
MGKVGLVTALMIGTLGGGWLGMCLVEDKKAQMRHEFLAKVRAQRTEEVMRNGPKLRHVDGGPLTISEVLSGKVQ